MWKYPKDFKFTGWHPNCRCTTIPILAKDIDNIRESEKIKELPPAMKDWLQDNEEKIQTAKSKPYFVRDNAKFIDNLSKQHKYDILYKNSIFEENLTQIKNKANLPNISIEKLNAINLYTGNYHRDINRYLRSQTYTVDEKIGLTKEYYRELVRTLNGGLEDLPKYKGEVYRATSLPDNVLEEYKKAFENGKPYREKSFFSTSYTKGILDHPNYEGNVEFEIKSKKGVNIEKLSKIETEKEVLFKAGTRFKIVDFIENKGFYEIKLEEL